TRHIVPLAGARRLSRTARLEVPAWRRSRQTPMSSQAGSPLVLQDRRSRLAQVRSMMSSVRSDEDYPGAGSAVGIGTNMRNARERLGWGVAGDAGPVRTPPPLL